MRPTLPALLSLLPLLLTGALAQAAPASFSAGKAQLLCGTGGQQTATWSGACKDGLADGPGVATWTDGTTPNKLDGKLDRGVVSDVATLVFAGSTYIGTFAHFDPHGQGFYQYSDGSMYEGGIDNDKYSGPGIFVNADRSRYEGEWLAGRLNGQGRATFALGGSYDGHWRDGRFDGPGTIVYIGGRTWTGQFKDGRAADAPPPVVVEQRTYRIENTSTRVGSFIPSQIGTSSVSGARWSDLSEGERQTIRQRYVALAPGDEPPYPSEGMRPVMVRLGQAVNIDRSFAGLVRMNVLVGADGKPKSAATIGKIPPEIARFMGSVMMLTFFKPAVCDGKPCEMQYPLFFHFEPKL
jgi:hypothetical protein